MASEVYILDWQDTAHGKQPKPQEVDAWLKERGIETSGKTKVYANGTVQLTADVDPTLIWPEFEPPTLTPEDTLGLHIRELVAARQDVMSTSESLRTPQERLLIAVTALLLFGYGVSID